VFLGGEGSQTWSGDLRKSNIVVRTTIFPGSTTTTKAHCSQGKRKRAKSSKPIPTPPRRPRNSSANQQAYAQSDSSTAITDDERSLAPSEDVSMSPPPSLFTRPAVEQGGGEVEHHVGDMLSDEEDMILADQLFPRNQISSRGYFPIGSSTSSFAP
jgi:hypothetical protein